MHTPIEPQSLPDIAIFINRLRALADHPLSFVRTLFEADAPLTIARAPGRLDVMGGIADYSGALVLELPTREATRVALQRRCDRVIRIVSVSGERGSLFEMKLDDFQRSNQLVAYERAQSFFQRDSTNAWAAYVAGVFLVLMRERGVDFTNGDLAGGANILVESAVPEGKGVSSSAALEVATMMAVCDVYDIALAPRELALLCQMVENRVVGAPCGVMDQMTSVCGQENQLLALLCQPAEIQASVAVPSDLAVWGIDSGIRHAVSGADYGSVRVGAFMGRRMLQELTGTSVDYLANLAPSHFDQHFARHIPESMRGAEFLHKFGETGDPVTTVDPARVYAVRQPTRHPIAEHFRVRAFRQLLPGGVANGPLLGELMRQSHASYSACGLGSDGTDALVELVREAGVEGGLFGAKITGGGSGGTVAVLGRADANGAVEEVANRYAEQSGRTPYVFSGSSPGAAAFGTMKVERGQRLNEG